MTVSYGLSTMAAMASRNTKIANKAKSTMKAFRTAVNKIIHDVESESSTNASVDSLHAAIRRVKADASGVLVALHAYSEELTAKNENRDLYDSLLKEFQEYMERLDKIYQTIPQSSVSHLKEPPAITKEQLNSVSRTTTPVSTTERPPGIQSQQFLQQKSVKRPSQNLASSLFEERSQQIHDLRSSVYGIQDLYVQIGDIVEYQGDQLDNIESNMAHAFEDTLEANLHLAESAAREKASWKLKASICILIACIFIIILMYRKL